MTTGSGAWAERNHWFHFRITFSVTIRRQKKTQVSWRFSISCLKMFKRYWAWLVHKEVLVSICLHGRIYGDVNWQYIMKNQFLQRMDECLYLARGCCCSSISNKVSSFTTEVLPNLHLSLRLVLRSLKRLNQFCATIPGPSTSLISFALSPFIHK